MKTKNKYRIVKETNSHGKETFYIQRKSLFGWKYLMTENPSLRLHANEIKEHFPTLMNARLKIAELTYNDKAKTITNLEVVEYHK